MFLLSILQRIIDQEILKKTLLKDQKRYLMKNFVTTVLHIAPSYFASYKNKPLISIASCNRIDCFCSNFSKATYVNNAELLIGKLYSHFSLSSNYLGFAKLNLSLRIYSRNSEYTQIGPMVWHIFSKVWASDGTKKVGGGQTLVPKIYYNT